MKRRVALIVETSSGYGRRVLDGIVRFMRTHDDWSVFLEQRDLIKKPPAWLSSWDGDGIISRSTTPELIDAVTALGVPLIELKDREEEASLPHVRSDDAAIGRLAAEHLLERGFRSFGYCGFKREAWSDRRQAGFVGRVTESGFECDTYASPWHGAGTRSWGAEQKRLAMWVRGFQKPFAIMACNDVRAQHVLDACSNENLSVPEEASVIGVDNDELLCRICSPPLSSVVSNAEAVGYRAAELLADLMDGRPPPRRAEAIPPLGIATRQSTDVVAIDDTATATALRFIRENACRGISVDDVVANAPLSRSTLERRLRQLLGRTPQEEIRTVQIKRMRELLATTDLPVEELAGLCGFEHPEYMHVVFKRLTGITPGGYRRQAQPQESADKIS
jgi:LacI family transcriptional regulator